MFDQNADMCFPRDKQSNVFTDNIHVQQVTQLDESLCWILVVIETTSISHIQSINNYSTVLSFLLTPRDL